MTASPRTASRRGASFLTASFLTIRGERVRAGIDPVGAGLQSLEVDGIPLVESYSQRGSDGGAPAASGATMFPWANRVRDGRWVWNGTPQQLTVTEPARSTANHGLVRTRLFDVTAREPGAVTLSTRVAGEPGYPFVVSLDVTYSALADGIRIDYRAVNHGTSAAPVAVGAHPYLRIGATPTDDLTVQVPARSVVEVDDRYLPTGTRSVVGTADDPQHLAVRGRQLNHCYGDLQPTANGYLSRILAPSGDAVELVTDEHFRWVQVYIADDFVRDGGTVRAVAVEPTTAPPDALNSGDGLAWVAPGTAWAASWSLRYVPAVAPLRDR